MTIVDCPTCGQWVWGHIHKCPPAWEARIPEIHDNFDWKEIHAYDADVAAKVLAERVDRYDHTCLDEDNPILVEVRKRGETAVQRFKVTSRIDIIYRATEVS